MQCAVCLWLVGLGTLKTPAIASTTIHGTSLCTRHAVRKLEQLKSLQDLGLR
jgi:hypothetical protein